MNKDELTARKEIWIRAWVAVAGASNCTDAAVAERWANKCLEAFDKAFKESED